MQKSYLVLIAAGLFLASCGQPLQQSENEYIEEQEKITNIEFHAPAMLAVDSYKESDLEKEQVANMTHLWKTGIFKTGIYEGQDLVTAQMDCEGPCPAAIFRFAYDEKSKKFTLLSKYSSENVEMIYITYYATDSTIELSEFDAPKSLKVWDKNVAILADKYSRLLIEEEEGADVVSLEDPSFASYLLISGCIYGVTGDSVAVKYQLVPTEFYNTETEETSALVELTFTDMKGAQSTKEFSIDQGGCGFTGSCALTHEALPGEESRLQKVGSIGENEALTFATLDETSTVTDGLEGVMLDAYNQYKMQAVYKEETPMSIADFTLPGNIFFVKMGSGKYVLVRDSIYQPTAECGKPVIYLYPEKDMEVSVKVGIESFTKTIPAYGNGWKVLAHVGGLLTNLADNKNYPYLFWEGNSSKSLAAPVGWTLKKSEVATVLPIALKKMGLNDGETSDFMEFWAPRLAQVSSNYIEFSFIGNALMDQIAPLTISPKPDTVIRVFMYFRGTNTAGLSMQNYTAPARKGFTVVEWGGTLR
ncbi:MAG: hypothetical protein AAB836_01295 [Patescibacteria group bacterium]